MMKFQGNQKIVHILQVFFSSFIVSQSVLIHFSVTTVNESSFCFRIGIHHASGRLTSFTGRLRETKMCGSKYLMFHPILFSKNCMTLE